MGNMAVNLGILPDTSPIWGIRGTARYGRNAGDTGTNYYVDKNHGNASDSNLGTDPEAPFLTVQAAITASNATVDWLHDSYAPNWIFVAPGTYAENLTTAYYCNIVGTGVLGTDTASEIHPATGSAMAGTFLGSVLMNLWLEVETAVPVIDLGIANNSQILGCIIARGNAGLATMGIQTDNASHLHIIGNRLVSGVATFPIGMQFLGGVNKYLHASVIRDNHIFASTTGIDLPANITAGQTVIQQNVIARPTTGISDLSGDTYVIDNWISAGTDAINHANLATHCIANHVLDNAVGAVEAAGTT